MGSASGLGSKEYCVGGRMWSRIEAVLRCKRIYAMECATM